MTPLADVALAFAKECLGWEEAYFDRAAGTHVIRGRTGKLYFAELGEIMAAVRGWCEDQLIWHNVTCGPGADYVVHITKMTDGGGNHAILGVGCDPSLCRALMAACVAAARKLKGAA